MSLAAKSQPDGMEYRDDEDKPTSEERLIARPEAISNEDRVLGTLNLSGFQRKEIRMAFPHLLDAILDDLEIKKMPETRGKGIFGSAEDCKVLEGELKRINATAELVEGFALREEEARMAYYKLREENQPLAPGLSEDEKTKIVLETYLHALDVLRYEPGEDPDMYEEDVKDRRRRNPLAKQTARRLRKLLDEARRRFPQDFRETVRPEMQEEEAHVQTHPTSMLPPVAQIQDEILAKLSTMEKEHLEKKSGISSNKPGKNSVLEKSCITTSLSLDQGLEG